MKLDPSGVSLTTSAVGLSRPSHLAYIMESEVFCPETSEDNQQEVENGQVQLAQVSLPQQRNWEGLRVFFSTFITIFLAELGDKTQLTTLLMSAESSSPWTVFLGAAFALIATSLLGVLLGQWLSKQVSSKTLETAAGAVLLVITVLLLWDVVHV